MQPTVDKRRLTIEQQAQLEQLQSLQEIEAVLELVQTTLDKKGSNQVDSLEKLGTLLLDIRESLTRLNNKEAAEMPDYAKPIVAAVQKLERELTTSIKKIEVTPEFKPNIQVDAPDVKVDAPQVDLSGVEKVLKKDLPSAFDKAIKSLSFPKINIPETNFSPVVKVLQELSEKLDSIDTASRMKPQFPSTLKVTNPDGTGINDPYLVRSSWDYVEASPNFTTPTTLTYKSGGSGGTTVATLTFAYSGSDIVSITKS